MPSLRASLRGLLLLIWTAPTYLTFQLGRLICAFSRPQRVRWRRGMMKLWARGVCRIMGFRVEVSGCVPAHPFLLVSNHLSYSDIFALKSVTGACFVSKAEVAGWPLVGFLARTTGTIFVERGRRSQIPEVLGRMTSSLARGDSVVFFPEGTSTRGSEVKAFKASLFEAAQQLGLPVHTACIEYRCPPEQAPAWQTICWWGGAPFGPHYWRMLGERRVEVKVRFSPEPQVGSDRREQAERAQAAVGELFQPLVSASEADAWADAMV